MRNVVNCSDVIWMVLDREKISKNDELFFDTLCNTIDDFADVVDVDSCNVTVDDNHNELTMRLNCQLFETNNTSTPFYEMIWNAKRLSLCQVEDMVVGVELVFGLGR